MKPIVVRRARAVVFALLAVLLYIGLHEGGHAVAAVLTSRTLNDVTILSFRPHVSLAGSGTASSDAFVSAAGSGLVLLGWLILALRPRRAQQRYSQNIADDAAIFFAAIEVLAWTVSAALHNFAPQGNDVNRFIASSGANHLLVAAVSALCGLACALVYNNNNGQGAAALRARVFATPPAPPQPDEAAVRTA